MKLGDDNRVPPSACTNCGMVMDDATGVTDDDHKGDIVPDPGDFTVCINCGHVMAFTNDLTLRDLTDIEIRMVAGDKRLIMIQQARANVLRDRAYCEDFVRESIKKKLGEHTKPSLEGINSLVDQLLASVPKPPRQAR